MPVVAPWGGAGVREAKMEVLLPIIVQLVLGAIGGNAAIGMASNLSLGTLGNIVVGAIGGVGAGQILGAFTGVAATAAASSGEMDISALATAVISGGVGGSVLTLIVGAIKKAMMKSTPGAE